MTTARRNGETVAHRGRSPFSLMSQREIKSRLSDYVEPAALFSPVFDPELISSACFRFLLKGFPLWPFLSQKMLLIWRRSCAVSTGWYCFWPASVARGKSTPASRSQSRRGSRRFYHRSSAALTAKLLLFPRWKPKFAFYQTSRSVTNKRQQHNFLGLLGPATIHSYRIKKWQTKLFPGSDGLSVFSVGCLALLRLSVLDMALWQYLEQKPFFSSSSSPPAILGIKFNSYSMFCQFAPDVLWVCEAELLPVQSSLDDNLRREVKHEDEIGTGETIIKWQSLMETWELCEDHQWVMREKDGGKQRGEQPQWDEGRRCCRFTLLHKTITSQAPRSPSIYLGKKK